MSDAICGAAIRRDSAQPPADRDGCPSNAASHRKSPSNGDCESRYSWGEGWRGFARSCGQAPGAPRRRMTVLGGMRGVWDSRDGAAALALVFLLAATLISAVENSALADCVRTLQGESESDVQDRLLKHQFAVTYMTMHAAHLYRKYQAIQVISILASSGGGDQPSVHTPSVGSVSLALQADALTNRCPGYGYCLGYIFGAECPGVEGCSLLQDGAWPMADTAYLILPRVDRGPIGGNESNSTGNIDVAHHHFCDQVMGVHGFVKWVMESPNAKEVMQDQEFTFIPEKVRQEVLGQLAEMRCGGVRLSDMLWTEDSRINIAFATTSSAVSFLTQLLNFYVLNEANSLAIDNIGTGKESAAQVLERLRSGEVQYALTGGSAYEEILSDPAQKAIADEMQLMFVPVAVTAVVPVAHVNASVAIVLTPQVIDDIFLSKINCWSDESITKLNPRATFEAEPIRRLVQAPANHLTTIFFSFLAATTSAGSCEKHAFQCSNDPAWPPPTKDTLVQLFGESGECPCGNATGTDSERSWNDSHSGVLLAIGVGVPLLVLAICAGWFSIYHAQAEKSWRVTTSEVTFPERPEILGYGTFGVVFKVSFRGADVAVKRFVTPGKAHAMGKMTPGDEPKSGSHLDASGAKASMHSGDPTMQSAVPNFSHSVWSQSQGTPLDSDRRRRLVSEVKVMVAMRHPNLCPILGVCLEPGQEFLIMECVECGSISDLLSCRFAVTLDIQMDLAVGIAQGMQYLHLARPPLIHKDLKSANVLVDSHLTPKVCDFGMTSHSSRQGEQVGTLFWNAPELLFGEGASRETDMYAFGVTLFEIFHPTMRDIYGQRNVFQVVQGVKDGTERPQIDESLVKPEVADLMRACWAQHPLDRPGFSHVVTVLQTLRGDPHFMHHSPPGGAVDVTGMARLPQHVTGQLDAGLKVAPQRYEECAVLFADIYNLPSNLNARNLALRTFQAVALRLVHKHRLVKVETLGSSCLVCAGLPSSEGGGGDTRVSIARFALDLLDEVEVTPLAGPLEEFSSPDGAPRAISVKIGCHAGSVLASVVGNQRPLFCLFGTTVFGAARLAASSRPNMVRVSSDIAEGLHLAYRAEFECIRMSNDGDLWLRRSKTLKLENSSKHSSSIDSIESQVQDGNASPTILQTESGPRGSRSANRLSSQGDDPRRAAHRRPEQTLSAREGQEEQLLAVAAHGLGGVVPLDMKHALERLLHSGHESQVRIDVDPSLLEGGVGLSGAGLSSGESGVGRGGGANVSAARTILGMAPREPRTDLFMPSLYPE